MVYFPVRKCYHIAKVSFLLILVVTILALFEKWRGGKRAASAFPDSLEAQYEKEIQDDEARIIPGLGEGGVAAYLAGEDKKLGEESEKRLAMNVYLSDRISYNRTLKDHRNPACQRIVYDAELPSASVILIFHNEPYSVVVRTIWSVINSCRRDQPWFKNAKFVDNNGKPMNLGYPGQDPSSPLVYLKELILVDDNSTLPELRGKLSHYVRTRLPPDLIRILRLPDREGLMKARIRGARAARGDVLIFLDAHCEAETDWLRPLLQRVRDKRDSVITPIIDVIDQSTFRLDAAEVFQVGGFTFTGHFTWIDVPEREKRRRGSDVAPTWSPTMAGGLFAISRSYFWELGAYDEQMAGWGGENLEMSFRIWQCGGTLETVPCSRVGHVFRSFHPYSMPANTDTHGINTARMADVWMDEYAELFYMHRPDLRNNPKIGDVTHRKILREKLHCKSFQWYLDNIYKEKFVPVRDAYGYGRFRNPSTGLCIDTLQREGADAALGVYPCHGSLQATQHFSLSLNHELRDEDDCAQVQFNRGRANDASGRKVYLTNCHGKQREQHWTYVPATKQIRHTQSRLCLDAGVEAGADLLAAPCSAAATQRWLIDYTEDNDFRISNDSEPTDQELRLRRLRGQRRQSRSLLSAGARGRRRRRPHRRRRDRFILRLSRTLLNGTEEHLEADVYCVHRRLLPNDTFVRDLVTVLNDRNIKVINNGRVFEGNKVTQLDPREAARLAQTDGEQRQSQKKKSRSRKRKPHTTAAPPPPPPTTVSDSQPHNEAEYVEGGSEYLTGAGPGAKYLTGAGAGPEYLMGADAGAEPEGEEVGAEATRSHRIIIEDFVEFAPTTEATKRTRRHKRRRTQPAGAGGGRGRGAPLALPTGRPGLEKQIHTPSPSEYLKEISIEDAPMVSESETADAPARKSERDRATGGEGLSFSDAEFDAREKNKVLTDSDNELDENWPIGESRYRAHEPKRRRNESKSKSIEEGQQPSPAPVKVVMRTNLTFNLGDDFFSWRARPAPPPPRQDSVLFSDLSMTPPALVDGEEEPAPPRAPPVTSPPRPQPDADDESSSSNSSE